MPFFRFSRPFEHVNIITYTGSYEEEEWDAYERAYLDMYASLHNRRTTIIFDMRSIDFDIQKIIAFIMRKKVLMTRLKPHTCRNVLAAVVLTTSTVLKDIVTNIMRITGQVSLFYCEASAEEGVKVVDRLSRLIRNKRLPPSGSRHAMKWSDLNTGNFFALILSFYIRVARHFLAK